MRQVTVPVYFSALFRELISYVACVALILATRRLAVVQIRNRRLHLTPAVVCAIVLWVGAITSVVGVLVACWIEARLLLPDRASRTTAFRSALAMAAAAAAAATVL